jgi:predicted MFS family arabinose efflux permease
MNPRLLVFTLGTFAIGTDAYVIAGILSRVAARWSEASATGASRCGSSLHSRR